MKKRLLAVLLCAFLVMTLLPATVSASTTQVWIWGKELTDATPYYHNGSAGGAGTVNNIAEGANAAYDSLSGTLTLSGLYVDKSDSLDNETLPFKIQYALLVNGDLTICLDGDNSISVANCIYEEINNAVSALVACGNLTIKPGSTGSGKLTAASNGITAANPDNHTTESIGVAVVDGTLEVQAGAELEGLSTGTITANSVTYCGVISYDITVSGGKINGRADATAKNVDDSLSCGVYARNTISITDGSIKGISNDIDGLTSESCGIEAKGIDASGGTVEGTSETTANTTATSIGINSRSSSKTRAKIYPFLSISDDAVVKGTSGNALVESFGIKTDAISVSGGTLTAKAGPIESGDDSLAPISAGLNVSVGFLVTGGTLIASGNTAKNEANHGNSYGIYCQMKANTTLLMVSGGRLEASAGKAFDSSIGFYSTEVGIQVSGGSILAKGHEDSATHSALNNALVLDTGITAIASENYFADLPTDPVDYVAADNASYLWVSVPVGPALIAVAAPPSSVSPDTAVTLSVKSANISSPTYQWYSNTSDNTAGASAITGATATTYIPPTHTPGTIYYYCAAAGSLPSTGDAVTNILSNIIGVTVLTPDPTVSSVAVSPASVSIQKGGTQTFSATVTGENEPAQTVTWTVTGGAVGTTIDANGVLTVAANETATALTVKATSTVDTAKSGTAAVTVTTPAPIEYEITKGAAAEWTKGSANGLSFTADADYDKFTGVSVDGTALSGDKYTSESGSTVVTLNAEYLEALTAGQHTLQISFTDGYAEAGFAISIAPETGDTQTLIWLGIALLAAAVLALSIILARRKR